MQHGIFNQTIKKWREKEEENVLKSKDIIKKDVLCYAEGERGNKRSNCYINMHESKALFNLCVSVSSAYHVKAFLNSKTSEITTKKFKISSHVRNFNERSTA